MRNAARLLEAAAMGEKLANLEGRRADLMRQLSRALAWQAFIPDAFEHGACEFAFVGVSASVPNGMRETPFHEWHLLATRADGSTRCYPLGEVPLELIPDKYRRESAFGRLVTGKSVQAWRAGQAAAIAGTPLEDTPGAYREAASRKLYAQAFRAGYRRGAFQPDGWHKRESSNG